MKIERNLIYYPHVDKPSKLYKNLKKTVSGQAVDKDTPGRERNQEQQHEPEENTAEDETVHQLNVVA